MTLVTPVLVAEGELDNCRKKIHICQLIPSSKNW